MKIQQLSLFLENRPGHLVKPCRLLADRGFNLRALTVADAREFGILRMVVSDWQGAAKALREQGYVVKVTEVLAVEVPDRPGGLVHLLEAASGAANIEYMYAFASTGQGSAILIFRFDDPDAAITRLQTAGINVLTSVQLCGTGGRA